MNLNHKLNACLRNREKVKGSKGGREEKRENEKKTESGTERVREEQTSSAPCFILFVQTDYNFTWF